MDQNTNNNLYDIEVVDLDYDFDDTLHPENNNSNLSADEALIECINRYGYVDLTYMCEISGLSIDELISELRGTAIFRILTFFTVYQTGLWKTAGFWLHVIFAAISLRNML